MAGTRPTRIYAGGGHYVTGGGDRYAGGLFQREPGPGPWHSLTRGLPDRVEVRAFLIHPRDPDIVYVGTQDGPYRTTNGGESSGRIPTTRKNGFQRMSVYTIAYA